MIHAFPCGTLPLDFVGTLRARRNPNPREILGSAELLDAWFMESGMVHSAPGSAEADLAAALELREAIYTLVKARLDGDNLPAAAVDAVNRYANECPTSVRLTDGKTSRTGSATQGLAALARETIEIIGGDDAHVLRECARPECTQVYLDRSRGHRREWCAMRTCGNRVKASQFRARHREAIEASAT